MTPEKKQELIERGIISSDETRKRASEAYRRAHERMGITLGEPTMTHAELRAAITETMRKNGIDPDDRPALRELMIMRYGDEAEEAMK